ASQDGTISVWALPPVPTRPFAHPDAVTGVLLTPDGNSLLTGGNDKIVRLWNLMNGQPRPFPAVRRPVPSVRVSGHGEVVAAGSADKTLTLWNNADAKELKKVSLPAEVKAVAVNADGKFAVAGLADNGIRLVDVTMGKDVKTFAGHAGPVNAVLYTPKG